jgi:chromate transport protein ChrA
LKSDRIAYAGFMPLIVVRQNYVKKNNLLKEQEIIDSLFLASVLPGVRAFNIVVDLLNHLHLMEKNIRSYAISKSAWLY